MKRTVKLVASLVLLCVLCSGCDFWMAGEYLSVTPHEVRSEPYANRVIEVNSYTQLRNAITNLVRTGADNGVISISAFNQGTIHFYVDTAIENVIENTAFGAYAVEKITYEIGTNRGASVLACRIHYRSGRQLPNKILRAENAQQVTDMITNALDGAEESVLVYMEQYEKFDVNEIVESYVVKYPDRVIEIPQVEAELYPEKGAERIVHIRFKYKTDALHMHQRRAEIEEVFRAAENSAAGLDDPSDIAECVYQYLMERSVYKETDSAMPAYDLLVQGAGNAKTFAIVYARICNRIGLDSDIVNGTREGKNWSWNVVWYGGREYHVDLLQCYEEQIFQLRRADQMAGYAWEK